MQKIPEMTLFIAPGCPHCPGMLNAAAELIKAGEISHLEVINIAQAPELAVEAGVRSVPTMKIGPFVLTGLRSKREIREWLEKTGNEQGLIDYINETLEEGQLDNVVELAEKDDDIMKLLMNMSLDLDTPMTSRIGISAIFEGFSGQQKLKDLLPELCERAADKHASVRADVAYLLGLSLDEKALPCLQQLADDDFDDVKETAIEAIDEIRESL